MSVLAVRDAATTVKRSTHAFKGYSIADVLAMSVDEALEVFSKQPRIAEKLHTLADVGLGYIKLGQPAQPFGWRSPTHQTVIRAKQTPARADALHPR